VNAADVVRKALEGSTLTMGYNLTLDRMKIRSMLIQEGWLIVDGDLSEIGAAGSGLRAVLLSEKQAGELRFSRLPK
jgi:hypothetical protein